VLGAPAHLDPERRRRAWLDADPQAPGRAGAFAVEAVALGGPVSLVDDAGRMASELVASAIRHTDAPGELTGDADDRYGPDRGPRRRREPPWQRQGRRL